MTFNLKRKQTTQNQTRCHFLPVQIRGILGSVCCGLQGQLRPACFEPKQPLDPCPYSRCREASCSSSLSISRPGTPCQPPRPSAPGRAGWTDPGCRTPASAVAPTHSGPPGNAIPRHRETTSGLQTRLLMFIAASRARRVS